MKPKTSLRNLLLVAAFLPLGPLSAQTIQWQGGTSSDWTDAANWSSTTAPSFNTTISQRIDINNGSNNALHYTSALGHTIVSGGMRSSSSNGGSMIITGGTFDSRPSASDFIGRNGTGTNTLTIAGGHYTNVNATGTGSQQGQTLLLFYGGGATGILNMESGSLTATNIRSGWNSSQNGTGIINLNGGLLSTNSITQSSTGSGRETTINFNGGTLRALGDDSALINSNIFDVNVLSGGAVIDSNGFDVIIGRAIEGTVGDGGLTLNDQSTLGNGSLTLSGTNTYTGETNIMSGTLVLATGASINDSSSINVGSDATFNVSNMTGGYTVGANQTLTGSGTVVGNTTIAGTHSAGNSPGIQTIDGNLTYAAGSTVVWELIDNVAHLGTRGTDFDGIDVTGALTFDGATTIELVFSGALNLPTGSEVDWSDSFWQSDYLGTDGWLIYSGATSLDGFDNLSIAVANWADGSGLFYNDYFGGNGFSLFQTGNDIYLNYTYIVIPEPSTALLGGLGMLFLLRRRR